MIGPVDIGVGVATRHGVGLSAVVGVHIGGEVAHRRPAAASLGAVWYRAVQYPVGV